MTTDLFQPYGHCWVFQIYWHIECSTFTASSFRIWNNSAEIPSSPLALFVMMLPKAHLTLQYKMSGSRWVIAPSVVFWVIKFFFCIVNEADVDFFFLEFRSFIYDPTKVRNFISGSSVFSKSNLYIWNFLVHILLKPSMKDFEHYLTSMWNECNCVVVWTFFSIAFLWDWDEN